MRLGVSRAATAGFLCLLYSCSGGTDDGPSAFSGAPSSTDVSRTLVDAPGGGASGPEWSKMYVSADFNRHYDSRSGPLRVRSQERDSTTGQWLETVQAFGAAFSILEVDTRGATEFYLLGEARNGDSVIEQWLLADVDGSYTAVRSRAETPFGTPYAGSTSTTTSVVGGGPFQLERVDVPEMLRIELYRGSEYGRIRALAPDVAGRFLHVAGGPEHPGIFTLGLFGLEPDSPTSVVGPDTLPELVACEDLGVHWNTPAGWTWWVIVGGLPETILAFDDDNDGLPTTFDAVTDDELFQLYPHWEFDRHDWW